VYHGRIRESTIKSIGYVIWNAVVVYISTLIRERLRYLEAEMHPHDARVPS
jgi:hypothetical protein